MSRGGLLTVMHASSPCTRPLPVERLGLRREIDARFPNTTRANDLYAMDLLESVVTQGAALRAASDAKALRALEPGAPAFARLARQYGEGLLRAREDLRNGQRFLALDASLPQLKKTLKPIDAGRLAATYASAGAVSRAYFKTRLTAALEKDSTYLDLVGYGDLLNTETDGRARGTRRRPARRAPPSKESIGTARRC